MYPGTLVSRCANTAGLFQFRSEGMVLGHADRVGGVAWHPQATISQSEKTVNLVSGAGDEILHLWSLERYGLMLVDASTSRSHVN